MLSELLTQTPQLLKGFLLPSLMVTTLLSSSLILMQVMVGHWDRSLWNLFHAPSSGKATVTSDSLFSSRIRRGMADSNLKVRECIDMGREREGETERGGGRERGLPGNYNIWKVKSLLKGMNVEDEYLSWSPACQWDVGQHGRHRLSSHNLQIS